VLLKLAAFFGRPDSVRMPDYAPPVPEFPYSGLSDGRASMVSSHRYLEPIAPGKSFVDFGTQV